MKLNEKEQNEWESLEITSSFIPFFLPSQHTAASLEPDVTGCKKG